jgi:hypothetical protein
VLGSWPSSLLPRLPPAVAACSTPMRHKERVLWASLHAHRCSEPVERGVTGAAYGAELGTVGRGGQPGREGGRQRGRERAPAERAGDTEYETIEKQRGSQ